MTNDEKTSDNVMKDLEFEKSMLKQHKFSFYGSIAFGIVILGYTFFKWNDLGDSVMVDKVFGIELCGAQLFALAFAGFMFYQGYRAKNKMGDSEYKIAQLETKVGNVSTHEQANDTTTNDALPQDWDDLIKKE